MMQTQTHIFETRQDMIRGIPFHGHVAEIGVFKGDFAQDLLNLCPGITQLDLVDGWSLCGPIMICGDQDGNNLIQYNTDDLEKHVRYKFVNIEKVSVIKQLSSDYFQTIPDASLDAVYIDADHSYDGCMSDLENAWVKVKAGGWIAGHDYEIMKHKCNIDHIFGVQDAVNAFMKKYNLNIFARANDGCASYMIRKA